MFDDCEFEMIDITRNCCDSILEPQDDDVKAHERQT